MFAMSNNEKICWMAAIAFHAVLLLWKAGEFRLPQFDLDLDPIIDIGYLEEDPSRGLAQRPGPPGGERKIMERIKDFFAIKPKTEAPKDTLSGAGEVAKLDSRINVEEKGQPQLRDRTGDLSQVRSVDLGNLGRSSQDLQSQKRSGIDIDVSRTLPSAQADAKLEDRDYKISATAVPFEIASTKRSDQVLSGDRVYVPSGSGSTSKSVRELSSQVSENLHGSGTGQGSLVDRGGGTGGSSIPGSGGSVDSRLARSSVGGGGGLVDSTGSGSGGGGGGIGGSGGISRGGSGTGSGFGDLGGGSAGRQTISGDGTSKSGAGGSGDKVLFEITGQLAGRKIIYQKIPEYPDWAKKEGIKARVGLYMEVLSDGKVKNTIIIQQTSGYPRLDKLTADALLEWIFEALPPSEYGKVQWGVITFRFDVK